MSHMPLPRRTLRLTDEDATNLADLAASLRTTHGRAFVNPSDTIRDALRVAAVLVAAGELGPTLRRYSADLAGR